MEKNLADKNVNEKLNESKKEIQPENNNHIIKKETKNLSQSTSIEKKKSHHDYFFSTGIYQGVTQNKNFSNNNLNGNGSLLSNAANFSNQMNNNYQYQNMINRNNYQNNNIMNPSIYPNNIRAQSLVPGSNQFNNIRYNNYSMNSPYILNQQNFSNMQKNFYDPKFINYMNNNTLNIQNFQNFDQQRREKRRHTYVFNPSQFPINLDNYVQNKNQQNNMNNNYNNQNKRLSTKSPTSTLLKSFNNDNKTRKNKYINSRGEDKINEEDDKIQEESKDNILSNVSNNESESESNNESNSGSINDNDSYEENSSKPDDYFQQIHETVEILKKDIESKDLKDKNKEKDKEKEKENKNIEKKKSGHDNTSSMKTNNESKNVIKNEDNEDDDSINEELKKQNFDFDNEMIKCLEGTGTESEIESVQIIDEMPKDIHDHNINNHSLSNEKCIMCLNEKTNEEGKKCSECPMILCQNCSSLIVIEYYEKKKHNHPLKISNKENCKCNNCKKKILNKKEFYCFCDKCNFYLCLKCYYPDRKEEDDELNDGDDGDDGDETMHNHPLKNISKAREFNCKLCDNEIETGYKCNSCDVYLCQECANFIYSHKKRKNLHEQHPLYLTVGIDWKCEKCNKNFKEKICFNCIKCSLDYCVNCFLE